jgi:hypothetical protein
MSVMNDELGYEQRRAQEVKRAHQERLMRMANVVGVGVGLVQRRGAPTSAVGLVVMVRRKVPVDLLDPKDVIPSTLDDVPVDVREVGDISIQA